MRREGYAVSEQRRLLKRRVTFVRLRLAARRLFVPGLESSRFVRALPMPRASRLVFFMSYHRNVKGFRFLSDSRHVLARG